MQPMNVAAGILAGGASSRMGRDKALLDFRGKPLLQHQLDLLRPLFPEVLIGGGSYDVGARVVPDVLPERCALTGVHALIRGASTPHIFVVACDMPFLNPALIRKLAALAEHAQVVLPLTPRGPEPLHAVYAKSCLPEIERAAREGDWKMTGFVKRCRTLLFEVKGAEWDVDGRSPFTNANTPEDWQQAAP
jgi:molybdopterin-guanine dinucleotide biosynthesis protein A